MLPPEREIIKISKKFPNLWQDIDACRSEHSRSWPGWCFIPRDELADIMDPYLGTPSSDDEKKQHYMWLTVARILAPWRVSKNVYRFDPDIYNSLIETPLRGNLPVELFFKMPEWAVYIETPDLDTYFGGKSHGFVASLNYSSIDGGEVILSLLSFDDDDQGPFTEWLYLKNGITIEELLAQSLERWNTVVSRMQLSREQEKFPLAEVVSHASRLLNLLLYICQVNSEYRDIRSTRGGDSVPRNPPPTKTKKGLRYFPPDKPTVWECGMRQGAELRRALSQSQQAEWKDGTHRSPVPHTRAAHWQSYLTGEGSRKDPTKGQRVLKWIHTTLVNARRGAAGIPVIRDVD